MSADEPMYDELLGAYALDAVDEEERRVVEEYLQVNPAAAEEVRELRETATMLAWSSVPAPEGLWDKIAASIEGDAAPAPRGELAKVMPPIPITVASRRRKVMRTAGAWVAASAAAAAIAVVAVRVTDDGPRSNGLAAAYAEARSDRDSRIVQLHSDGSDVLVEAVVDPRGHGYVQGASLPALSSDRTYQLWGVIDGSAISLGVLGHSPDLEPFSVDGDLTTLVITIEKSGGVISNGNPDGAYAGAVA